MLEFLSGMSPWWWVAIAFGIGVLEMATLSFFLIWPALAALSMAGILLANPDMSGNMQLLIFAILSVLLTVVGRSIFNRYGDGAGEPDEKLNQRAKHVIGRIGNVLEFDAPNGIVEIEGMRWRANWAEGADSREGDRVRVTAAVGMVLSVEPIVD